MKEFKSISWKIFTYIISSFVLALASCNHLHNIEVKNISQTGETVFQRVKTPLGFSRENYDSLSWPHFLQNLPLFSHGSLIKDFNNKPIANQNSHAAVINYDVGSKDLQQCADAIIRLRAEYLFSTGNFSQIQFKFTSGDNYSWLDHSQGIRPKVRGNKVAFEKVSSEDKSYENFRKYLDIIFTYAGTISLNRDLKVVSRSSNFEIGDVIVKPGSPGHAVFIVDRAKNENGEYIYLLAQGYTPAQSIHIINNIQKDLAPWFKLSKSGSISSNRYHFSKPNIRRF